MRRPDPKYLRIAVVIVIIVFIALLTGGYYAYTKREALLQHELEKAETKAFKDYNLELKIGSASFNGLSTVDFTNISVIPQEGDSLLSIGHFTVSIKLLPLLFGKIKLEDVALADGHLKLTNINGVKNFEFLFKKKRDTTETGTKKDLSELIYNLVNGVLYKIPDNLDVKNFLVTYIGDSTRLKLFTKSALIKNGELNSTIVINDTLAAWHFTGTVHPADKDINIKLYADGKKLELPFIKERYKMKVDFDDVTLKLTDVKHSEGETEIKASWGVHNLLVNQPALSSADIVVPDGSIDADIMVGQNYISVDSSSVIHLKKITAHPFIKYTLRPAKAYELKLNTGWLNAQHVFDSFPMGIFDALDGIKVAGRLNYSLNFNLDTSNPDAVVFDSRLDKDGFNIIKYGKTDLTKLNNVFVYTPYEKGKPMPSRIIGPANPYYTPLDQIAPDLRNAVMTAEDPTFYKNNGFVEESIRKSIATDFKDKKFKRGGSTISMQLVKNSFLSREKTLARKVEETLIVWMIVNNNIMTKNRMLEVYFNIIEWGPNVYGIGEASRYYFGKTPADLTLGESIYLASIVPKPKAGLYAFLPDGSLRPNLVYYFNTIGRLMAGQYLTKPDSDGAYGFYSVHLKPSLRREVAPVDSAAANKILNANTDDDAIGIPPPPAAMPEPVKRPTFLQRIFGKKDTVAEKTKQQLKEEEEQRIQAIDTAGKTKKQIRQEKREIKKQESERAKALKEKGVL